VSPSVVAPVALPVTIMAPPAVVTPLPPPPVSVDLSMEAPVDPRAVDAPHASRASAPAPPALSIETLHKTIIEVVAHCTGYPVEMLGLDMDIEADLGVDSIKRVEILSAMNVRAPGLPEVSAARMASMRTLREIANALAGALSEGHLHSSDGDSRTGGNGTNGTAAHAPSRVAASPAVAPARHVLRTLETPAIGLSTPGLAGARRLVVTDDGAGIAAALVTKLAARQVAATLVDDVPTDADAVVHLAGLRPVRDTDEAVAVNRTVFRAARSVAARFAVQGGTFVVVQDTGGDFGLSGSERAWLAGVAALARTAAMEWPRAHVRALDVERGERGPEAIAEAIATELLAGGTDAEIGLRADGARLTRVSQPAPLPVASGRLPLSSESVVVASGGARGVTAACLIALARATRARFVLLGRSTLAEEPAVCRGVETDSELKRVLRQDAGSRGEMPNPAELGRRAASIRAGREIRRTLAAVEAAGAQARYAAVDVADGTAVTAVLQEVRSQWGPITGVVHGAGVLADKLIADKTDAQFDFVLHAKIDGLRALLDATRCDELSFVLLWSSVAAWAGNQGQADYAMANEVLNKVAALEQRRRGPSCLVRALGWGPWDAGMVDDGLRARFAALGVPLIRVAEGARLFLDELAAGTGSDTEVLRVASGAGEPEGGGLGRGLAEHGRAREIVCDVLVDASSHPFLEDHRIKGTPVVPIALALEWFARAARACRPDLTVVSVRGVKVLRGIRLAGFHGGGDRLVVRAQQLTNGDGATIAVTLAGADGTKHYTATCDMRTRPAMPARQAPGDAELAPWSEPIYGAHGLFHGPCFHVIRTIEGVSATGLAATVVGTVDRGWPGTWQLDPALIDAGLQLALLWTRHALGHASLPTGVEALHVYASGLAPGPIHAVLEGRHAYGDRAVSDIVFATRQGVVIAELTAVETHLLPRAEDAAAAQTMPVATPGAG